MLSRLAIAAAVVASAAAPATADEPAMLSAVATDSASDSLPPSPTFDVEQTELEAYGHSLRLVGNKSHTRFPTHSYVAFTFDDGPAYHTTPAVLDALDKYDIPATFFVNGVHLVGDKPGIAKNIETLRETVRRGYHIGNHTFHHIDLKRVSPARFKREIERSAQVIEDVIGYHPYLVRFPYGVIAQKLRDYLDQEGYVEVRWNIDSSDFKLHNRRKLRESTIQQIIDWNGGVVLFHDPKPWTSAEIAAILDDFEQVNCDRLKTQKPLLLPVSLHYYAREKNGKPRPVPPEVERRTQRYVERLPARCKARVDKRRASK